MAERHSVCLAYLFSPHFEFLACMWSHSPIPGHSVDCAFTVCIDTSYEKHIDTHKINLYTAYSAHIHIIPTFDSEWT